MRSLKQQNLYMVWDPEQLSQPSAHHFSPEWWRIHGGIIGESHGRGTTYFVRHQDSEWVLRRYLRGGIPARFSKERYLFTGARSTRVWQELKLLEKMRQRGLPVPAPVAGLIQRSGISYSASILIEKIPDAEDLFQRLRQGPVSEQLWLNIGRVLGEFHAAGIYHADLNCHNILIDKDEKIWLIDFDQGAQQSHQGKWQQQNLARLQRSLRKELGRCDHFHWQESDWNALMAGYAAETA